MTEKEARERKVFSREKYLSVMDEIDPNRAEMRRGYVWPFSCDGKTKEECTALGYVANPDWMEVEENLAKCCN